MMFIEILAAMLIANAATSFGIWYFGKVADDRMRAKRQAEIDKLIASLDKADLSDLSVKKVARKRTTKKD